MALSGEGALLAFAGVRLWTETRLRPLVRSCTVLGACTGFDGSTALGGEARRTRPASSSTQGYGLKALAALTGSFSEPRLSATR
jgi:hypothetical protein